MISNGSSYKTESRCCETNLDCILAQGPVCVVVIPVHQVPVLLLHVDPRAAAAAPPVVGPLPHVDKPKEGHQGWKCDKANSHVESNWVVIVLINWLIIIALISTVNEQFALNFQVSYLPWLPLRLSL